MYDVKHTVICCLLKLIQFQQSVLMVTSDWLEEVVSMKDGLKCAVAILGAPSVMTIGALLMLL